MSSASTPFLFPANPMATGALNRILSLFHATLCPMDVYNNEGEASFIEKGLQKKVLKACRHIAGEGKNKKKFHVFTCAEVDQ